MSVTPRKLIFFLIVSFALAVGIHALLLARGFFGISADESARTLDALARIPNGTPHSDVWLPFHRIVIASALRFFGDLFIVPRVISFVFGLLTLASLIWLAHEIFHDRAVTAWAAVLAALFPPRVILSAVPLSEIEFSALLVAGIAAFLHWLQSRRPAFFLLTAILIGLSTSVRYEGWLFAAAFIVLSAVSAEARGRLTAGPIAGTGAFALLLAFPIIWSILAYRETGSPFAFASSTIAHYEQSAGTSLVKLLWRNPLTQFLYQNGTTLNLLGAASVIGLWKGRKHVQLLTVVFLSTLAAMALLAFFGKALPTHNPWRVAAIWSYLVIPFTAYWIVYDSRTIVRRARRLRYGAPLCILAACVVQIGVMTRAPFFSHTERNAGLLIRSVLARDGMRSSRVLIETSDWSYLNIVLASNMPDHFIYNTGFEPFHPLPPVLDLRSPVRLRDLLGKGIRLLVFKSDLQWDSSSRVFVQKLGRYDAWTIYEIAGIPAPGSSPPIGADTKNKILQTKM
jgi:hypothetical protein